MKLVRKASELFFIIFMIGAGYKYLPDSVKQKISDTSKLFLIQLSSFPQMEGWIPPNVMSMIKDVVGDSTKSCEEQLQLDKVSYCLLQKYEIRFDTVVMAQHIEETGWEDRKSKIYLTNHNGFGMKHNSRGISLKENLGHAYYSSIEESVKDYSLWQKDRLGAWEKRHGKCKTSQQYINEFLPCVLEKNGECYRYAESKTYEKKVTNILSQLNKR